MFKIEIKDNKDPKSWGIRNITQMTWSNGYLYSIIVDFGDPMIMFDYNKTGRFVNVHGNLIGEFSFSDYLEYSNE